MADWVENKAWECLNVGDGTRRPYVDAIAQALHDEREACAKIAETLVGKYDMRWREFDPPTHKAIAKAIRERS